MQMYAYTLLQELPGERVMRSVCKARYRVNSKAGELRDDLHFVNLIRLA